MEHVGSKLRELRKMKGLSLKKLAERTGCAASYLSMVENGKIDPGISRLKKIAAGLEITIVDLFQDRARNRVVMRRHERTEAEFRASKTRIEILVPPIPDKKIDARLARIAPGGSSEGDYRHPGEEFGLVLEGKLELTVGGITYQLSEGDSFYFESNQNHRFVNNGRSETVVVWVNHPASW
jgi:transcriptional regulator with XRE-family HTH domain